MTFVAVVLVGVLGGLAGALQSQFLGVMEEKVGTLTSTFITYGGGGLAIGLLILALRGGRLAELREIPWWALTAGLMGLVVVASLGISISRIGLGAGLTLFTGSSLVLAALIEHFGFFGMGRTIDAPRVFGIALVIFGTWLVVRG
jgi:bacterial/archaeal transporter family-2 protein